MKVYNYDPETKEYTGEDIGQIDPVVSEKEGKDVYLTPANSTSIAPPEIPENKQAVLENGAWKLVPDFRSIIYWNGHEEVRLELGQTPKGTWTKEPPKSVTDNQGKEVKRLEVRQAYEAELNGQLSMFDTEWDIGWGSLYRLQAVKEHGAELVYDRYNKGHSLEPVQLEALIKKIMEKNQELLNKKHRLLADIEKDWEGVTW